MADHLAAVHAPPAIPAIPASPGVQELPPGSLASRRAQLVGEVARQRRELPTLTHALRAPVDAFHRGMEQVQSMKRHPAPLIGAAAGVALLVLLIKPRRLAAAGRTAKKSVQLVSMLLPLLARLQGRPHRG